VLKRHGAGTYISKLIPLVTRRERRKRIAEQIDTLLAEARLLKRVSPRLHSGQLAQEPRSVRS
jgi:hypothetical protein